MASHARRQVPRDLLPSRTLIGEVIATTDGQSENIPSAEEVDDIVQDNTVYVVGLVVRKVAVARWCRTLEIPVVFGIRAPVPGYQLDSYIRVSGFVLYLDVFAVGPSKHGCSHRRRDCEEGTRVHWPGWQE